MAGARGLSFIADLLATAKESQEQGLTPDDVFDTPAMQAIIKLASAVAESGGQEGKGAGGSKFGAVRPGEQPAADVKFRGQNPPSRSGVPIPTPRGLGDLANISVPSSTIPVDPLRIAQKAGPPGVPAVDAEPGSTIKQPIDEGPDKVVDGAVDKQAALESLKSALADASATLQERRETDIEETKALPQPPGVVRPAGPGQPIAGNSNPLAGLLALLLGGGSNVPSLGSLVSGRGEGGR